MRVVIVDKAGSYDRLRIEARPDPTPGPGQVHVKVRAVGVNYADCVVRMGLYASAREYVGWPIVPGFEVAGEVAALGQGVEGLSEGDPVIAVTRFGGYTTDLLADRDQVFALPEGWSFEQGAAFPAVSLTAWFALYELAHPRPGTSALVHSAAGGVGGALLQMLKLRGCRAVGVVGGPHKVDVALALGAEAVIDKSRQDLWGEARRLAPEGYGLILDANGAETLQESYDHLGSPGKLVVYGFHTMLPRQGGRPSYPRLAVDWLRTPRFNPLNMTNQNRSVLAFNLSYLFDERHILAESMTWMLAQVAQGRLRPPPVQTFAFDRVADAHRALESGQTVGKLALIP